jgi:hypothetical protein
LLQHLATGIGLLLPQLAPDLPIVGVAHSWHSLTYSSEDSRADAYERMARALGGLFAIAFVSAYCRSEGLGLGLRYPPPQALITHAEVLHEACVPLQR